MLQAREVGIDLDPVNLPADEGSLLCTDTALEQISSPPPACLQDTPTMKSFNSPSASVTNQPLLPMTDWFLPDNLGAEGLAPPPSISVNTPQLWQSNLLSLTLPLVEVSNV